MIEVNVKAIFIDTPDNQTATLEEGRVVHQPNMIDRLRNSVNCIFCGLCGFNRQIDISGIYLGCNFLRDF